MYIVETVSMPCGHCGAGFCAPQISHSLAGAAYLCTSLLPLVHAIEVAYVLCEPFAAGGEVAHIATNERQRRSG
jgi:hypothetical protein